MAIGYGRYPGDDHDDSPEAVRERKAVWKWGKMRKYVCPHCGAAYEKREWKPPRKRCLKCLHGTGHYRMWLARVEGTVYDPRLPREESKRLRADFDERFRELEGKGYFQ